MDSISKRIPTQQAVSVIAQPAIVRPHDRDARGRVAVLGGHLAPDAGALLRVAIGEQHALAAAQELDGYTDRSRGFADAPLLSCEREDHRRTLAGLSQTRSSKRSSRSLFLGLRA